MNGVDRVLWSEEVYSVPVDPVNVLSSFKKIWDNNGRYSSNSANSKSKNNNNNNFKANKLKHNIKRSSKTYY
jgi:hypothetical protein